MTSRLWVPFALSLSRKFYVYIFDRPGFGESESERKLDGITNTTGFDDKVWEYDGNLARQAEAFSALFKSWELQWKGKRPHVIAHDNAGLLSLRAYLLHDCHYASLFLIDVVAIGPFGLSLFKAVGEDPSRFENLPDSAIEGILESYIRAAAYHELPKAIMEMLKAPWLKRPEGRKEFLRELCQADNRSTSEVEGLYSQVGKQIPVQIIWGAEDEWLPVKDAWRLGEALGAKEVIVIEKAGHLSFLD